MSNVISFRRQWDRIWFKIDYNAECDTVDRIEMYPNWKVVAEKSNDSNTEVINECIS